MFKNSLKISLLKIPCRVLIISNETIQQLFSYILCGLLLNTGNKNIKNNKKANIFYSQKNIFITKSI